MSRHPEWDLMLLAGLTAREIAEVCHRDVATVRYHLRRREHYDPGFRTKHEAAVAARGKTLPSAFWRRRVEEVAAFQAEHARLPRTTGEPAERALQKWLAARRRLLASGDLTPSMINLLQTIEGWAEDAHQRELDDLWRTKLAALIYYVHEHNQLPRYRTYATEDERTLGVWLHTQNQRRSEGTLLAWRNTALDTALPGWRSQT